MNDRRPPLAGIRVLAQGLVWAGPFGTMILADLGAEVIEIESIQHLSPTRTQLRHLPDAVLQGAMGAWYLNRDGSEGFWDRNTSFNYAKRGHLSATFDLHSERGHELFLQLVTKADVFLENNAAGVVEHLGIGWEVLHAANPRLVMVRFPGFGITGPYAHHKGYGMDTEAIAGHTTVRGYAGDDPSTTPISVQSDPNAGAHAAWVVQAALLARERTGDGQLIEMSQSEAVLHHIPYDVLDYAFNGRERGQRGNDHPAFAPYGVFPCAGEDRWIAIACTSDAAFAALMQQLDAATFADDERFATTIARLRNRTAVNELVAERTRRYAATELAGRLQGSGVAAAALAHQQEMHTDEHLHHRGYFTPITHPAAGTHVYPGPLGKLAHTADVPPFRPAPMLGEHNEYVFKKLIGLSDQQYQSLVDDQIIGTVYLETAHA
jgi:benzylsuccinate CoA-transferase BbsF subunit/naphthyl-2-methylsuccinate CoA transferase subunit